MMTFILIVKKALAVHLFIQCLLIHMTDTNYLEVSPKYHASGNNTPPPPSNQFLELS